MQQGFQLSPLVLLPVVVVGAPTDRNNSLLSAFSTRSSFQHLRQLEGEDEAVEIRVFVLQDTSLCAGLDPIISTGMFLYSNRTSRGSLLSRRAFLNKFLVILTADSALPLAL